MRILATGNKSSGSEDGFSLVELLCVLAILSLMIGVVAFSLPQAQDDVAVETEAMTAQLDAFLREGTVRGEMRALGVSEDGISLYRHDGLQWQTLADLSWPDDARIVYRRNEARVDLPEDAEPSLLFEPYGVVPDFSIRIEGGEVDYRLTVSDRGRLIREVAS